MPKLPSIVLGISYGHGDSSAALIVDGRLVAAAEEERFTRVKHYGRFPANAIEYCLKHAKLEARQVEIIAIPRDPRNAFFRKLSLGFLHPGLHRAGRAIDQAHPQPLRKMLHVAGLRRARVQRIEHHLAHMASARWLVDGGDVALLSLDGLGDFVSAAIGKTTEEGIRITDRMFFPDSLGFFYTAMTHYLGFPHFGEEFKVMGLSSYGKPRYLAAMRELIREAEPFGFRLNMEAFPILRHPIHFTLENARPKILPFFQKNFLTQVIGIPPRKPTEPLQDVHRDLACSVQLRFEEIANHLLTQLYERAGGDALALAGGCSHNSVWVGKIPRVSPYRRIIVAPAAHDAGLAVGAAAEAAARAVTPEGDHWALLGPSVDEVPATSIATSLREQEFADEAGLIGWAVKELADGKILGLMHGRMEFGPRALGSRSIIADPRFANMRDKLNERVKHRESFRPFAASVLWEHQAKWFVSSFFSPSMEAVFEVQESARNRILAVTHVDNTCRVQSVVKETQPFFWKLLEAFRKHTGVPMLLNTSFNDNEPIVCTVADALRCFQNTEMDGLIVGGKVYTKTAATNRAAG